MNFILHLLDILIPRFSRIEYNCVKLNDEEYRIVDDEEDYNAIYVIKSLRFIGYPFFENAEIYELVDG
jgi:hypothetical protein